MSIVMAIYNERSWAIDLAGYLKQLALQQNRSIKNIGGEQTIRTGGGSLFPDLLLFGDSENARILQGWELKMPDTSIEDADFRENAEAKARALGLDSFLIWNVSIARLYALQRETDTYTQIEEWTDLEDIIDRRTVRGSRDRWQYLAAQIFGYLSDLFDRGTLEGRRFVDAYASGGISDLILANASLVKDALAQAAFRSPQLRAQVTLWWDQSRDEYGDTDSFSALSQAVISNWIGKILFGHILQERDARAQAVHQIHSDIAPQDALAIFERLSNECNFWTIFGPGIGLEHLPLEVWSQLQELSHLLADIRVGSVSQSQLSEILEATVDVAVRKTRGQYPTPSTLANLLVRLSITNINDGRFLDPCCGSGTIPRAALELKLAANARSGQAASTVFASDLDPQATQLTTLALAKPELMNEALRVFQHDVFSLGSVTQLSFRDPVSGDEFVEEFGLFDSIASNLPFVSQAGRTKYEAAIEHVTDTLKELGSSLSGRADVSAYVPLAIHSLLVNNGRLGVIVSNACLGTEWGDQFFALADRLYKLRAVVASGVGRWFQNSKVVAVILVFEKRDAPATDDETTKFVLLNRPIHEFDDAESLELATAQIELGQVQNDMLSIREVSRLDLSRSRQTGLTTNAQFVDCHWVHSLPLVEASSIFDISRGERRGFNEFFYPTGSHGIEPDYLGAVVKSPKEFQRLVSTARMAAFSCSRSEEELEELGHVGALGWINRFKTEAVMNRLKRAGHHWYEMRTDSIAELVMFTNLGDRLFVGRLTPPAFVDQRLIKLVPKDDCDLDLIHALLNSSLSMFLIEALGFGRGEGALDLSSSRIKSRFHILNPGILDDDGIQDIKNAFAPLLEREILSVDIELAQDDRRNFDQTVLTTYGIDLELTSIYSALASLYGLRAAATD